MLIMNIVVMVIGFVIVYVQGINVRKIVIGILLLIYWGYALYEPIFLIRKGEMWMPMWQIGFYRMTADLIFAVPHIGVGIAAIMNITSGIKGLVGRKGNLPN
jgi:hypothetical protein